MQDLISILFRAVVYSLFSTKPGFHLTLATLIAFASGMTVSITTGDVVAARWAFFVAFIAYFVFAFALRRMYFSAIYDIQKTDAPRAMKNVFLRIVVFILWIFAIQIAQDGLELLGMEDYVSFWISLIIYFAVFLVLMLVLRRKMQRRNGSPQD